MAGGGGGDGRKTDQADYITSYCVSFCLLFSLRVTVVFFFFVMLTWITWQLTSSEIAYTCISIFFFFFFSL